MDDDDDDKEEGVMKDKDSEWERHWDYSSVRDTTSKVVLRYKTNKEMCSMSLSNKLISFLAGQIWTK